MFGCPQDLESKSLKSLKVKSLTIQSDMVATLENEAEGSRV